MNRIGNPPAIRWQTPQEPALDHSSNITRPTLRIGAVNYLNSKPLVWRLAEQGGDWQVLYDLPSRLADSLAAGRLDVALIPVVEYFAEPSYRLISDACVASEGPVQSVKVFFRKPPREVRSLALDEGSRTSAALSQVLLEQRHSVRPERIRLPIGADASTVDTDAVLLIGDRAMLPASEPFVETWDLATEWRRWTGLPFVFACWVARPPFTEDNARLAEVGSGLAAARDEGLRSVCEIASAEASPLGLTEAAATHYLSQHLHFRLGKREHEALRRFRTECLRLGLIEKQEAAATPRS